MIISFKLETDNNILEKKVNDTFKKYHTDMVVANILETRYNHVTLYLPDSKPIHVNKIDENPLEKEMIKSIIIEHNKYMNKK